jgi:phosphoesterase RecJ-like protein
MSAVRILAHQHPDGDTLGSAYALARALQSIGKHTCVDCVDPLPHDFTFCAKGYTPDYMDGTESIVTVDVADAKLLGRSYYEKYGGIVDLNIDHHSTNTGFARETYLEEDSAATAELVADLIDLLCVVWTTDIAACIYAGISTDTGCFRYAGTTSRSHRYAARMMEFGVQTEPLDRMFFETKTRSFAALERLALEGFRFFCKGQVCLMVVTQEMYRKSGSNEDEFIRLVPQTRQIEGVLVGIAIRERSDGSWKISLRTHLPIDASAICAKLGGGGHAVAAGCESFKPLEETIADIVRYTGEALQAAGLPV